MEKDTEDITCPLVDMNFIFSCSTRYFCLLYKHTNNDVFDDFPKISEDFPKLFRKLDERLKISEEGPIRFRSYSNTSEYFLRDCVVIAMAISRPC